MIAPVRAVVAFFADPVRPQPVALFRLLLGAALLADILFLTAPDLHLWLGDDGMLLPSAGDEWIVRQHRFDLLRHPLGWPFLSKLLPQTWTRAWSDWGETTAAVRLMFALWIGSVVLVTLGLFTRPALAAAWMLTLSFHHSMSWITNGADRLMGLGLFLLLFARAGEAWSLDALLRRRRTGAPPRPIPAWPLRLMQVQVCALYFFTALSKIAVDSPGGGDWVTGEAAGWMLSDIVIARVPSESLPFPLWLLKLTTWGSLALELTFPLLMCFTFTRRWALIAGVLMHVGVFATVEVGSFSTAILCWYVLLTPARVEPGDHFGPRSATGDPSA